LSVVIITGSGGLVGSEAVKIFAKNGLDVVGIDNDMRRTFFGDTASTKWNAELLTRQVAQYRHESVDIRDQSAIDKIFSRYGQSVVSVIHCAAQPSHDWAAKDPMMDFSINATGTLVLLEAVRKHSPDASFLFLSTNKVYGDTPNLLPLVEHDTRWELRDDHPFFAHGIDESMSIDNSKHSLFGVSKAAADLIVQEYGRYFGIPTACFRGGCLTGPAHAGAELHGFLAYLVKCSVTGAPYTVYGYKGKQVRDNIHSHDLVDAIWQVFKNPPTAGVYNIGGGRSCNCSILEAITLIENLVEKPMNWSYSDDNRSGDHIWWVSDTRRLQQDYPGWQIQYDLKAILEEMVEFHREREFGVGQS
jgi:CDP-paratose 2-epimerase